MYTVRLAAIVALVASTAFALPDPPKALPGEVRCLDPLLALSGYGPGDPPIGAFWATMPPELRERLVAEAKAALAREGRYGEPMDRQYLDAIARLRALGTPEDGIRQLGEAVLLKYLAFGRSKGLSDIPPALQDRSRAFLALPHRADSGPELLDAAKPGDNAANAFDRKYDTRRFREFREAFSSIAGAQNLNFLYSMELGTAFRFALETGNEKLGAEVLLHAIRANDLTSLTAAIEAANHLGNERMAINLALLALSDYNGKPDANVNLLYTFVGVLGKIRGPLRDEAREMLLDFAKDAVLRPHDTYRLDRALAALTQLGTPLETRSGYLQQSKTRYALVDPELRALAKAIARKLSADPNYDPGNGTTLVDALVALGDADLFRACAADYDRRDRKHRGDELRDVLAAPGKFWSSLPEVTKSDHEYATDLQLLAAMGVKEADRPLAYKELTLRRELNTIAKVEGDADRVRLVQSGLSKLTDKRSDLQAAYEAFVAASYPAGVMAVGDVYARHKNWDEAREFYLRAALLRGRPLDLPPGTRLPAPAVPALRGG